MFIKPHKYRKNNLQNKSRKVCIFKIMNLKVFYKNKMMKKSTKNNKIFFKKKKKKINKFFYNIKKYFYNSNK